VIKQNAAKLIFVHNHPRGNTNPSDDDIKISTNLKEATATIDVSLYDHLIVAGNNYSSFAGKGLI